jgi:uncharacterized protein DUF6894
MRYYFDLRDGDHLMLDDEGMEMWSIERVQQEAAKTLADMARDAVLEPHEGNRLARQLAIEVRSDYGPVLQVRFSLETGTGRLHS